MTELITLLLIAAILLGLIGTHIYGIYLCFKKHWVAGVLSLLVPGLATVVALFKYFKIDLLETIK